MFSPRFMALTSLPVILTGCLNSTDSRVGSLTSTQKAEGFLVVTDVSPDPTTPGSFLVTCANESGKTVQETRKKSEIESNLVCKAVASGNTTGGTTAPIATKTTETQPKPTTEQQAAGFVITFSSPTATESYLKARSGLDVSKNKATLKEGSDYCVVPKEFSAASLCKTLTTNEYKAVNAVISGCSATTGYLYQAHFSVKPALIPDCK